MTVFADASDITDAVLAGRVREEEIAAGNDYVSRLAASFGVESPEASPAARRLAAVIACRECCLSLVGTDATVQLEGSRQDDIYERKYNLYASEAEAIEKRLTKADFTSEKEDSGAWVQTITIHRA